ncbi:MAG: hypothetical protein ACD_42C00337G0003 [uncultured bacterium]|nr:MAG: hypothetical protein ACD_42C00337G0003 [uncultured bacterium]
MYVEGSLRTRKWTDKNNVEKYTTEIIADEMQMLDGRGATQSVDTANTTATTTTQKTAAATTAPVNTQDFDDDIPF